MPPLPPAVACFLIMLLILGTMALAWIIRNWPAGPNDNQRDKESWP